jgi:DNA primase
MKIPTSEVRSILQDAEKYVPMEDGTEDVPPLRLPIEYQPLWRVNTKSYSYRNALAFVRKRGLTIHDIYRYQVGYCESGDYKGRVIIPSYDVECNLNYFVSRSYYHTPYLKYMNPETSKDIIVFENLINWKMPVVLVEGVFDAIAVRRNAIPILGKIPPDVLKKKLIEEKPPIIYVMLDDDALRDALEIEKFLRSENLNVKMVTVGELDASDMGFVESWKHIEGAEASSFSDIIESML